MKYTQKDALGNWVTYDSNEHPRYGCLDIIAYYIFYLISFFLLMGGIWLLGEIIKFFFSDFMA